MSDDEIAAMSVKALKAHITSAGLSCADCIEKADLTARAKEASAHLLKLEKETSAAGGGGRGQVGGGSWSGDTYDSSEDEPI